MKYVLTMLLCLACSTCLAGSRRSTGHNSLKPRSTVITANGGRFGGTYYRPSAPLSYSRGVVPAREYRIYDRQGQVRYNVIEEETRTSFYGPRGDLKLRSLIRRPSN